MEILAMRTVNILVVGLMVAVVSMAKLATVEAAIMTWQTPMTISGNDDVNIDGTLERAYTFGVTTEIRGVVFQNNSSFVNTAIASDGIYSLAVSDASGTVAPYTSLTSEYKALLGQGLYSTGGSGSAFTLTLDGLTVGQRYLFQSWVNESRGGNGAETLTSGGATSGVLTFNSGPNVDGGVGQYVIGTFTADSTGRQVITYTGDTSHASYPEFSGFQLRTIPEPSTITLLIIGLIGLLAYAWRRRR
jgi:hypothetical protein